MFAPAFATGIAVFACGLFAQAGYAKLKQPDAYRQPLQEYLGIRALPAWAPRAVGGLELAAAFAVVLPATRGLGAIACVSLLLCYAVAMAMQVRQGRVDLRCGCSGPASETRVSPALVVRNVMAALPCVVLVFIAGAPVPAPALLIGAALGVVLLLTYLSGDQMIANRQRLQGWAA